jgi:hypothetical protein
MCARIILTHNLGGNFAPRRRPKWMGGLELDGWNTGVSINGRTVAFEYMGHYWHKADVKDLERAQHKGRLCETNGVTLLVVWAPADRPDWAQQLKACQTAVDEAGLEMTLEMPPEPERKKIARTIPQYIRDRLAAIGHDPIEFDQRGKIIRSLCRLSGKEVLQAADSLTRIRGCRYCQSHASREQERRFNARAAASAMWKKHRAEKAKRRHEKITNQIVAFVRQHHFESDAMMHNEVVKRFGINASQSCLQYARSGRSHRHLDAQYPPVRKSASPYTKDHAAVKRARVLLDQGLSLGKISEALFREGHRTHKGTVFSAAQVKAFKRLSEANDCAGDASSS